MSFLRRKKNIEKTDQSQKPKEAIVGYGSVIGTRAYQQDAYRVIQSKDRTKTIAVLCDGMGGLEGGEEASNQVADFILSKLQEFEDGRDYMESIDDMLAQANQLVRNLKDPYGLPMRAGTTLVIAVIEEDKMNLVSVGDSSLYYYEAASGEMMRLTNDHNYLYMAEQLRDDESFVYDPFQRGDALVSFIGAPEIRYVDRTNAPIELGHGDKILVCSDGLYNALDDETIKGILVTGDSPQSIAEEGIKKATAEAAGGQDNTTVVVIEIV